MKDARILVVDDESDIRSLLDEILSEEGYVVTTAANAGEAREAYQAAEFDLVLLDIWMPDIDGITLLKEWHESGSVGPVVMMSGHGTVDTAVEATRLGAVDFIEKPVSLAKLLRTVGKALAPRRDQGRTSALPPVRAPVGKSEVVRELREQLARVARYDTHTLICGESGSGREAAARYLAASGSRSSGPFVVVLGGDLDTENCELRLFGEPGAPGLLDSAQGGVLFIDDLALVSPEGQRRLLTVLRDGEYLSGTDGERHELESRVMASAPPGFEQDEAFSADLMALLSGLVVRVPALRSYAEDVPELLRFHVDMLVDAEGLPYRRFSVAAQNRLRNYPWPGNLRELKSLVKRMLILGGGEEISLQEVEAQLDAGTPTDEPLVKQDILSMPLREAREHFERAYLQQQLMLCNGKVGQLAKRVGMERTHLYRKLRALGVDFRQASGDD
jgi:two-component system nitrogen regulation response regulator NtrX